ncbi:yjeF C-terminal region, hydroxyethylthiazole kinase-related/yjeF N-terminal region [Nitrosomonas sp. PY1]|uniref:NAD(P)H-hydrate dehydratase n=1 Tax=Nitrosomonas sp. PY1 TaxID=1803906 RepID=UPI001FC7E60B|nr:NAD(P)H-hydrate dehydratase [Nitrosomonas sp. PY1]GKS69597.1 yjeF C-terminal region, hydroxyethylthiazole kinase-related/yjeF N-terminal region [Nitrosomonas sp. PY1]
MQNSAIYLTEQIRSIEHTVFALPHPPDLMMRAGYAVARITRKYFLKNITSAQILVLAGPGNNGGDAFVVARHLKDWGHAVTVVFTADTEPMPHDAKNALQAWQTAGGKTITSIPNETVYDVIIDGLFGIGLDQSQSRPIEGTYRQWIAAVNQMKCPVLSLDIPSGLGSDNGSIYGIAIQATITVTFIGLKPGLFTNSGRDCCGRVILETLHIHPDHFPEPHSWLLTESLIQSLLPPPRVANSHKGSYGSVAIIGGSDSMIGAPLLAGRAALHLGSGRVYVGMLAQSAPVVDFLQPELMLRTPADLFAVESLSCIIAGPGMGTSELALELLACAIDMPVPLILDADALNLIAQQHEIARKINQRKAPTLLTPHPAEAARLLNCTTVAIQNNRMQAALQLAQQFNCQIVLKGAGSICCLSDGQRYINITGNAGLSTAGTGDVLTGMIAAFSAQGLELGHALLLGVYLHGAAADDLLQENHGPVGMTASELPTRARKLLNHKIHQLGLGRTIHFNS